MITYKKLFALCMVTVASVTTTVTVEDYKEKGTNTVIWTEFSFMLKPSSLGGVGVFATHDIPAGTVLFDQMKHKIRRLKIKDVPAELIQYCVYINDEECICPERFDRMEIGWFINHSSEPNIGYPKEMSNVHVMDEIKSEFCTIKDIKAGDEILMNYNDLNEPEDLKDEYYK